MTRWTRTLLAGTLLATMAGGALSAREERPGASVARRTTSIDAGWRFLRSDPAGAQAPSFDDSKWGNVTLPDSFNAGDGERPDYYRGPAWYRRAFDIAAIDRDRRLYVQFDGAATAADVFLNGRRIGRHEGGHAAFRLDLTDALQTGRNVLAVRVDNASGETITPLGGDFTIFGGLYRGVSLIETGLVHADLMDHGGPGVYARLGKVDDGAATISLLTRVANDGAAARAVPVEARILDAEGQVVARGKARVRVGARTTGQAATTMILRAPHRWDGVRDPYLYRIEADVGGDVVTVPLGVRTMAIDAARGFLLNGKPYPLHGVNLMHSARPGRGTAVGTSEIDEDFAILRELGSTGVRLVHFQHPQAAYDAADRLGLVAWTEIGLNSKIADTDAFRANAVQQMRELIAQNYNHPSVAMWGIGNEVYADDPGVMRALEAVNAAAKAADPARATVYAHCCQADDVPRTRLPDVIGFNRYFGWYPDQSNNTLDRWAAGFHAKHPDRPFAISEYGAGASILQQEDPPRPVVPASGWHPEQYQALFHERSWRAIADKPYIFGSFVWVGFDLASGGRNEGDRPGINDKGLVTYDRRTRKDAWYWYQANWSAVPMVHITSRRFVDRPTRTAEVKVYSNATTAELFVDGRSAGSRPVVDHIARWPVELGEGGTSLVVKAGQGAAASDAVVWRYRPAPAMLGAETDGVVPKP